MKNVGRQLRDEGLVMFLQKIAGMKGITPDASRAKGVDADTATTKRPATPDAGAPDAVRPTKPDAAKTPASTPEGPTTRKVPASDTPDAALTKTPDASAEKTATATDATSTKPKADAPDAATATRPRSDSMDADTTKPRDTDAAEMKPEKTPETVTDKTPDAGTEKPADAKPETKPPEQVVDNAPETPVDKPDPRKSHPDPEVRAKVLSDDIAAKTRDGEPLDAETVERIMLDPDAMRKLKQADPDAWTKFDETRQKIYASHDAKLKDWIEQNVPAAKDKQVVILTVGHADGVDRDYRAGYVIKDPAGGCDRFIEFPKERWAPESQKIFAGETGGPNDAKGAELWAVEHQQLATDQYHAEASVDMADQGTVYDPETGTWNVTQFEPNVELVKRGESTLLDPEGYGDTYRTKVLASHNQGNMLDAYTQASKAVHSLECVLDGYAQQGYGVKDLPPKIKAGIDVINAVRACELTPEAADATLKAMHYDGGLPDFMERVAGVFASLKWVRKG